MEIKENDKIDNYDYKKLFYIMLIITAILSSYIIYSFINLDYIYVGEITNKETRQGQFDIEYIFEIDNGKYMVQVDQVEWDLFSIGRIYGFTETQILHDY